MGSSTDLTAPPQKVDPTASLAWPVYPHNPHADAPEKELRYVVAVSVPL
jgi:hypothetical protein